MPKLSNALPKYRRHSSGNARVTINGRDYLLGPYGTKASKLQYDRVISEWLASGRSASFGGDGDVLSIAELLMSYLKYAKGYYGDDPNSEIHRIKYALRPLKELYSKEPAAEFGPLKFKAVREHMTRQGRSRSGTNANMKRIARVFRWAASEELLPAAIYDALRSVPGLKRGKTDAWETEKILPIELAIVRQTQEKLPPVLCDMIEFQLLTGCRPQDACGVTPDQIDRSGEVWVYQPAEHKGSHLGRDRKIYIGPKCQEVIRPYLLRAGDAALFSPAVAMEQRREAASARRVTPPGFGNSRGKKSSGLKGASAKKQPLSQYTSCSYRRAIHYACDLAFKAPAGTKGEALSNWKSDHRWSPNRLRHSRGTEVRKEFGLEASQIFLGHASADVTQVYAERDEALAFEVAKRLG